MISALVLSAQHFSELISIMLLFTYSSDNILSFSLWQPVCLFCLRLKSQYEHTHGIHNSGVVWGRVLDVHAALLQEVEVDLSVVTEWNSNQLGFTTAGKISQRSTAAVTNTVLHSQL